MFVVTTTNYGTTFHHYMQVTEGSVIVTVYFIQSSQGANLAVLLGQMEQDVSYISRDTSTLLIPNNTSLTVQQGQIDHSL